MNVGRPPLEDRRLGAALGAVLGDQRTEEGLSRDQLCRRAGVSINTLMKIEQGQVASPGVFLVDQLAQALAMGVDDVLRRTRGRSSLATDPVPRIVSAGYEGRTIAEFIAQLKAAGVAVVADVRLTPISRKKGFSKNALREALAEAGIQYMHLKALGNPKENRAVFASEPEVGRARFRRLLDDAGAREAVDVLAGSSRDHVVAVLCFEADAERCHRRVITDELRDHHAIPIGDLDHLG